jgi:multidrug efflux pump subunit AcrA (membrane-fusion protein)
MTHDSAAVLPAGVRELLDLFAAELPDVRFADLDREALEADAERVRALGEALAQVEAALERARADLNAAREHLLDRSRRALAYARIYADGAGRAPLVETLERLSLSPLRRAEPRAAAPAEAGARRRGRPPKNAGEGALLPLVKAEDASATADVPS